MPHQQTGPVPDEPQTLRNPAQDQGAQDPASAPRPDLPSAPCPPQDAPPQDQHAAKTTDLALIPPDPDTDPRAFWAYVAGVAPDQLIFAPQPSPLLRRWAAWRCAHPRTDTLLARGLHLWRIFWFGPRHPAPAPLPRTPLNLAPWTNQLLPHPAETPHRSGPARLRDYSLWYLSHPGTRFETHAWRCSRRADIALGWRIEALRNTLAGKPSGPPPWLCADAREASHPPRALAYEIPGSADRTGETS